MITESFQQTFPTEIMPQVFGRHSMKSQQPSFQERMVGVYILDVVNASQHPDPFAQVDCTVGYAHLSGRQGKGAFSSAVGAENRILGQKGFQDSLDRKVVVLGKDRIGCGSRAVPNHQDRNLFTGKPSFGSVTAPVSGFPGEIVSLPLVGAQEPSLVGLEIPLS